MLVLFQAFHRRRREHERLLLEDPLLQRRGEAAVHLHQVRRHQRRGGFSACLRKNFSVVIPVFFVSADLKILIF